MKRIGIECHNLEGNRFGVGQTLMQLLEEISRSPRLAENFEFYLYFKKEIPPDKTLESPIFKKRILRLPFFPPSFNIFYHILIPIQYFKDKLDGFFFPGYMLPAFFAGRSVVVLTNDVLYEARSGNLPFQYRAAYWLFSRRAAKHASRIMTISHTAKKEISEWYKIPLEKIIINPWGLNKRLANASFTASEIARVKEKFGVKNDFIFSWGQAFPRRHFREAILAFAKIAPDFPRLQYLLSCADKYNPPILKDLAEKINNDLGREAIVYKSYIEEEKDLLALIKSARLVIYISASEAMGLPPLEALAMGTPALVAENDLNREIFGNNVFFAKNLDSADDISRNISRALADEAERRRIIENGGKVVERFSWQANLNALVKIFNETF